MPPKKTQSRVSQQQCDICCQAIDPKKGDSLFCNGDCQRWIHRFCASVSTEQHKKIVADGASGFLCPTCCRSTHQLQIAELTDSVAALKCELSELKEALSTVSKDLADVRVSHDAICANQEASKNKGDSDSYAARVQRGSEWQTVSRTRSMRQKNKRTVTANQGNDATTSSNLANDKNLRNSSQPQRPKVRVEGKRKVWGTLKATPASAVSNTIKTIAKIEGLDVKRKYYIREAQNSAGASKSPGVSKWWFIISGEEVLLDQLAKDWNAVKFQTNWTLEPVYSFCDNDPVSQHSTHKEPTQIQHSAEHSAPLRPDESGLITTNEPPETPSLPCQEGSEQAKTANTSICSQTLDCNQPD